MLKSSWRYCAAVFKQKRVVVGVVIRVPEAARYWSQPACRVRCRSQSHHSKISTWKLAAVSAPAVPRCLSFYLSSGLIYSKTTSKSIYAFVVVFSRSKPLQMNHLETCSGQCARGSTMLKTRAVSR